VCLAVWVSVPAQAVADDPVFGPNIEIGVGLSQAQLHSRPEWSGKNYQSGFFYGALRVFKGLSVQGGYGYGMGDEPRPDWIDYGVDVKLWTHQDTYREARWYGLRYEVPSALLKVDLLGMDFLCAAAGWNRTKYGIKSQFLMKDGEIEKLDNIDRFRTATVEGPYFSLSGRWRLDTDLTKDTGAWFGAYGLELGVRRLGYWKSSVRHDNILKPKTNFNCYEIFLIGFVKIKLLYD